MLGLIKNLFDENRKKLASYHGIIQKINSLEPEIQKLNDDELREETDKFKKQLKKGKTLDEILPRAYAIVS